jgi:hypothetical protein
MSAPVLDVPGYLLDGAAGVQLLEQLAGFGDPLMAGLDLAACKPALNRCPALVPLLLVGVPFHLLYLGLQQRTHSSTV